MMGLPDGSRFCDRFSHLTHINYRLVMFWVAFILNVTGVACVKRISNGHIVGLFKAVMLVLGLWP